MQEPDPQNAPVPADDGKGPVGVPVNRVGSSGGDSGSRRPPTLYVLDRLLYMGPASLAAGTPVETLQATLTKAGLPIEVSLAPDPSGGALASLDLEGPLADLVAELSVTSIALTSTNVDYTVDARRVLELLRQDAPALAGSLTLDHVLSATSGLRGQGWGWPGTGWGWPGTGWGWPGTGWGWPGTGWGWPGTGVAEFGMPGRGGRMPVHLSLDKPEICRCDDNGEHDGCTRQLRRPVVVIPDTGLGHHPWFDQDPAVEVGAQFRGLAIGGPNHDLGDGIADAMTGSLAPFAGHGTFIAGLVRQRCPEARLLAIPVMPSDGLAEEEFVHQQLLLVLLRHVDAVLGTGPEEGRIDVLTLSMGFYPDDSIPASDVERFWNLFKAFCDWGVVVCAAAGNDATTSRFNPAAFSEPDPNDATRPVIPVLSVGALTPGGEAVALFSNAGDWVHYYRVGASVVSTVPITLNGGQQASQVGHNTSSDGRRRSTIDPDGYRCGFGVWSGTSFAAPILAGEAARALGGIPVPSSKDPKAQASRAAEAADSLPKDPS